MQDNAPPSVLRIPVTIALALLIPPFAPFAWVGLSGGKRAEYMDSDLVRWGMRIVVGTALPLLVVFMAELIGLADDPNPIGLGLLWLAGNIVGIPLLLIGIIRVARR